MLNLLTCILKQLSHFEFFNYFYMTEDDLIDLELRKKNSVVFIEFLFLFIKYINHESSLFTFKQNHFFVRIPKRFFFSILI